MRRVGLIAALALLPALARAQNVVDVNAQFVVTVSPDHATATSYEIQVKDGSGATVFTRNVGKPAPQTTACTLPVTGGSAAAPCYLLPIGWTAAQFGALAAGNYTAVAVAYFGTTAVPSAPSPLFVIPAPPPVCTYSLTPTTAAISSADQSGTFAVATGPTCAWTAVVSAGSGDFFTVTPATGTGPATVRYHSNANPLATARTVVVTVQGQTFTVTQAGFSAPTTRPPGAPVVGK